MTAKAITIAHLLLAAATALWSGCSQAGMACDGRCSEILAIAADNAWVCREVWPDKCGPAVSLESSFVPRTLYPTGRLDFELALVIARGLHPTYRIERSSPAIPISGAGEVEPRPDHSRKINGLWLRHAKQKGSVRGSPVIHVVSNTGCSGMYEWLAGETWPDALNRLCGLPSDRPAVDYSGWIVGRGTRPGFQIPFRYFATSIPPMAWGTEARTMPEDLVVLFSDDYCTEGTRCIMVGGHVLQPGPLEGELRQWSRDLQIAVWSDHATPLFDACASRIWFLRGTNSAGIATAATSLHYPAEPGVQVMFVEGTPHVGEHCGYAP